MKIATHALDIVLHIFGRHNQGSAVGSGRPKPDRAIPIFRAAGSGLGPDIVGLVGLGLKVVGLAFSGQPDLSPTFFVLRKI